MRLRHRAFCDHALPDAPRCFRAAVRRAASGRRASRSPPARTAHGGRRGHQALSRVGRRQHFASAQSGDILASSAEQARQEPRCSQPHHRRAEAMPCSSSSRGRRHRRMKRSASPRAASPHLPALQAAPIDDPCSRTPCSRYVRTAPDSSPGARPPRSRQERSSLPTRSTAAPRRASPSAPTSSPASAAWSTARARGSQWRSTAAPLLIYPLLAGLRSSRISRRPRSPIFCRGCSARATIPSSSTTWICHGAGYRIVVMDFVRRPAGRRSAEGDPRRSKRPGSLSRGVGMSAFLEAAASRRLCRSERYARFAEHGRKGRSSPSSARRRGQGRRCSAR